MPLTPGQILNNRYRIVKLLGQGGFGAVYKAWDTRLSTPCAVKESLDTTPEAQRQFLREAQILATMRHPNLPRVTDHFVLANQGQYLVMDFVEGQDLEEILRYSGGHLPEAQALGWINQVCDALTYLHSQNPPIIHRDIKPANIRITPNNQAMLVDFGIAKIYDAKTGTTKGAQAITPGYSSPEQYGQGDTDARSDIYSLGATLYTLLTSIIPEESVQRMLGKPLILPHQLNPQISPATVATILKAMQLQPEKRYQSAVQFQTAFSHPLSERITSVTPIQTIKPVVLERPVTQVAPGQPTPYPRKKFALLATALFAALFLLAGITVIGYKLWSNNRSPQITQELRTIEGDEETSQPIDSGASTATLFPPTYTASPTTLSVTPSHTPILTSTKTLEQPAATSTEDTHLRTSPQDGMVMIYIPAGTFQMGTNSGDPEERSVHTVTLDAFWIDRTEVTNAMYALCVAEGQCTPPSSSGSFTRVSYYGNPTFDDYPVLAVNWFQANAYCNWASRQLPTEAQWEYAARGGIAGATYPWGEGIDCSRANYSGCVGETTEVGSYSPNGYGLYDMAGNVWEWVVDYFSDSYSSASVTNPTGPTSGGYRVIRGGTWDDDANSLRVTNRYGVTPERQNASIGFRCAVIP